MFRRTSSIVGSEGSAAPARQSISAGGRAVQAAGAPPVRQVVRIAVLPPRLPEDVAPPTGLGPADTFGWDESINWSHNQKIENEADVPTSKKYMRKIGLTTQRKRRNEDLPPFVFREVPYATWRKHYAKDKDGRYRGTHAPAEDCLLLPEDVTKWRLEDPVTKADQWTRGRHVLPTYAEVQMDARVPEYTDYPDEFENIPDVPEYNDHTELDRTPSMPEDSAYVESPSSPPAAARPSLASTVSNTDTTQASSSIGYCEFSGEAMFRADGKTAAEIIEEAKARAEAQKGKKRQWKNSLRNGANTAFLGANFG